MNRRWTEEDEKILISGLENGKSHLQLAETLDRTVHAVQKKAKKFENKFSHSTIYILLCQQNKYYIGKSHQPNIRIKDHFSNRGSVWTKNYPPIKTIETIPDADDFEEDLQTKKYMQKYGIDNVRGGSYTAMILPGYQLQSLEIELRTAEDRCFRCNQKGHMAKDCKCHRCWRIGHNTDRCYAKTRLDGTSLEEDSPLLDTGTSYHPIGKFSLLHFISSCLG